MKPNSDRVRRVISYFDDKGDLKRLRLAWVSFFQKTEQTWYNKLHPLRLEGTYFSEKETRWIEQWARENGMPEEKINQSENIPAA